jgi:hypothetical protein
MIATIKIEGVTLDVVFEVTPIYPQTSDHPAEGGDVDILAIKATGDIFELLDQRMIDRITEAITN